MARKKKLAKPTLAEAKKIKAALQRQYPQMFQRPAGEIEMLRGMTPVERKKLVRMVAKKQKAIRSSNKPQELKKKYRREN